MNNILVSKNSFSVFSARIILVTEGWRAIRLAQCTEYKSA